MYYLNDINSRSNITVTTREAIVNRLKFWVSPLTKLTLPYTLLVKFYDSIIEEGMQDEYRKKLSLQEYLDLAEQELKREEEMKRIREIQIEELRLNANVPTLTERQIINRKNARKPKTK